MNTGRYYMYKLVHMHSTVFLLYFFVDCYNESFISWNLLYWARTKYIFDF